jgi:hypothetical protein
VKRGGGVKLGLGGGEAVTGHKGDQGGRSTVRRGDRVATLAAARAGVRGAPKDDEEERSRRPEEQEDRRNRSTRRKLNTRSIGAYLVELGSFCYCT